jgi:hypothetical protein
LQREKTNLSGVCKSLIIRGKCKWACHVCGIMLECHSNGLWELSSWKQHRKTNVFIEMLTTVETPIFFFCYCTQETIKADRTRTCHAKQWPTPPSCIWTILDKSHLSIEQPAISLILVWIREPGVQNTFACDIASLR